MTDVMNTIGYKCREVKVLQDFKVTDVLFTGSRLFGDATDESDWDFVIHCTELPEPPGDWVCSNDGSAADQSDDDHRMFRYRDVNVIVVRYRHLRYAWAIATRVAIALKIPKAARPELFNTILQVYRDDYNPRR